MANLQLCTGFRKLLLQLSHDKCYVYSICHAISFINIGSDGRIASKAMLWFCSAAVTAKPQHRFHN
ncbi:MAG: hypothetical protein ACK5HK_16335 [Pseudanabaena sp.]